MQDVDLAAPLEGLKVADFSQGVAGPHCATLLAGHGADVIKIEPVEGDWGRHIGPGHADFCADAIAFNRGKRSLALNLKSSQALRIASGIACEADVVIESFRPGVMAKFGLDAASVRARHPRGIYISITGFGQRGPRRDQPATDLVAQSFSGLMSINRDGQGRPQRLGMIIVDVVSGVYACQAVLAAVLRQQRTGQGAFIDCSLMECAAAFQAAKLIEQQLDGGPPPHPFTPVGVMETSDGYLSVAVRSDAQWDAFCRETGRDDLATDPRFSTMALRNRHEAALMPLVRDEFRKRGCAEWVALLTRTGAHNAPVMTHAQFVADAQVEAMGSVSWVEQHGVGRVPLANVPGLPRIGGRGERDQSPHVGQHTREILGERGFHASAIDELIAQGAVGQYAMDAAGVG
jgi:crotonobetainyl-CoA:carnitine CoA-transferase CaiB-like acyl-CoA transferase